MKGDRAVLSVAAALTESGWLYLLCAAVLAWARVRPWPAPWVFLGVVLVSAALNLGLTGARCLVLWVANLAAAGLAAGALLGAASSLLPPEGTGRLAALAGSGLVSVWLWLRAALLVHRPPDYIRMAGIFDLSAVLMILILLIAELAGLELPGWHWWVFGSLAAGAAGLAMARRPGTESAGRFPGAGPVAAGLALVLLPAVLIPVLAYPWLAGAGRRSLTAALPLADRLAEIGTAVLLWLMRHGNYRAEAPVPPGGSPAGAGPDGPFAGPAAIDGGAGPVAGWIAVAAGALIALAGLAVFACLLWMCFRALLRRAAQPAGVAGGEGFRAWLHGLRRRLRRWIGAAVRRLGGMRGGAGTTAADECYRGLLRWGGRRGRPRRPNETPDEYRAVLAERFPEAAEALSRITEAYVRRRYGPASPEPDGGERAELRDALRVLRRIRRRPSPGYGGGEK